MERREFLQALGATGAAAALSPLSAITLEDDWYVNSRIGLALRKPPGWHFVSLVDFHRAMDDQAQSLEEDRQYLRKICEQTEGPILVISKYHPIPESGVCPTIQIYATPLEGKARSSPDQLHLDAIVAWHRLKGWHRDYRAESPPTVETIGNQLACSWNYTYRFGEGDGELVRTRAILVDGTRAEFSVGMAGPASGPDVCDAEFAAVKGSMGIE